VGGELNARQRPFEIGTSRPRGRKTEARAAPRQSTNERNPRQGQAKRSEEGRAELARAAAGGGEEERRI